MVRKTLELVFSATIRQPAQITMVGSNLALRSILDSRASPKKLPFCVPFCVVRFCQFLKAYRTNGHRIRQSLPVSTHKVVGVVE